MFEAWKSAGLRYRHRGHETFYRDEGSGPVLVLIHGFPSASWDWHLIWPELVRRYRVIAPDMIGFGWSAKPKRYEYSILDQATLHEGLLRSLGITAARVLAHDYGDTVAQELLARDDERPTPRLASVCLLNGGLFPETHRPRPIQRLLAGPLGSLVSRLLTRRRFAQSMTSVFGPHTPPSATEIDGWWTLITQENGHRLSHELIHYMAERRHHRERWVEALRGAGCPLALINGSADPISGAHMVARYRELVGHGLIAELPGIGHYPQVEAPELVLQHYFGWRDGLRG